jgi:GAF domain-containing protein
MLLPVHNEMTQAIDYDMLERQVLALIENEQDVLANCANFVALLYTAIPDINWLGIYVLRNRELVLGPFQGLPACVRIPLGQGVCGTAAENRATLRVADVHEFAGHIACDPASNAELVVPLLAGGRLLGVVDIDSPVKNRFSAADEHGVEKLCQCFISAINANLNLAERFI